MHLQKEVSYTLATEPMHWRCTESFDLSGKSQKHTITNMEPAEERFGNQSLLQKKPRRCLMLHGTHKKLDSLNWILQERYHYFEAFS